MCVIAGTTNSPLVPQRCEVLPLVCVGQQVIDAAPERGHATAPRYAPRCITFCTSNSTSGHTLAVAASSRMSKKKHQTASCVLTNHVGVNQEITRQAAAARKAAAAGRCARLEDHLVACSEVSRSIHASSLPLMQLRCSRATH